MKTQLTAIVTALLLIGCGCGRQAKRVDLAQEQLQALATAIDIYDVDREQLPGKLEVLGGNPPFGAPYLKAKDSLIDPWGTPYWYDTNSVPYDLRSAGPDRRLKTEDDITPRSRTPNKSVDHYVSPGADAG
jgi:type II secretory pathway pseudopilin PulG